jgi:glycosyltransferase involved in cell wall biosynthesis
MSAGRMSAAKGFDVLIKAFAIIAEETSARLMILGDGEEMENLKSLARRLGVEDRTAFPGFQKNPLAFMSKARLFVLASRSEGFGNVIVEAMFCDVAIVSTDCPNGPREILGGGRYGELVRVDDAEGLAKAMKRALSRPADKGLLRRRALDFSEDSAIEKYARLLEKISG